MTRAHQLRQMKLSIDRWIIQLHMNDNFNVEGQGSGRDVASRSIKAEVILACRLCISSLGNWISSFVQVELHLALVAARQQSSCQPPR
jgi:hypothetical protein